MSWEPLRLNRRHEWKLRRIDQHHRTFLCCQGRQNQLPYMPARIRLQNLHQAAARPSSPRQLGIERQMPGWDDAFALAGQLRSAPDVGQALEGNELGRGTHEMAGTVGSCSFIQYSSQR